MTAARRYEILEATSTRRAPGVDEWIHYAAGEVVAAADLPAHVKPAELVAIGAWRPYRARRPKGEQR